MLHLDSLKKLKSCTGGLGELLTYTDKCIIRESRRPVVKSFFKLCNHWIVVTHFVIASTPALAQALGTTKPDPLSAYVVVMFRKTAPANSTKIY